MSKYLLRQLFDLVQEYKSNIDLPQNKVIDFNDPGKLVSLVDFNISEEGVSDENFSVLMKQYIDYSVHTGNRQFHNQLFSGFNIPAFAGDVLSILTNTSMYTYEAAPMATLIEKQVIDTMNGYIGYPEGDGIFLTGGSNANLIAMFSARNRIFPESRFEGSGVGRRLKAFVSEHAHYSFENAANILGIGAHNVVKIPVDQNGMMIPLELDIAIEQAKEKGEMPFFVAATLGTTVMAAFDPLEPLAEVCRKHNVWFHADGAFGGSLILSDHYRYLFNGSELTDSFCWDAHKLMGIPLISSVILVKQKGTLQHNLSDINTDYIYHDNSGIEDLGKKSVQCGRRVDAVKLWFAWKYYGRKGYGKKMENLMEMASHAERRVHDHAQLQLVAPRQTLTICFRYVPRIETNLNEFNFTVRENLRKSGRSMVNVAWLKDIMFIRLIVSNNENTPTDVDNFFNYFLEEAAALEMLTP